MMRDFELLTDAGGIDKSIAAACALATHQPESETFHLPARLHE